MPSPKKKLCRKCNREKFPREFSKNKGTPDGRWYYCKECTNKYVRLRHRKIRLLVLEHYGESRCACCGESRIEFLAIDHINGGGYKHHKERKWESISLWLFRRGFPEGYRVLCHNCNMALGFYGYCPHQKGSTTGLTTGDKEPGDLAGG